MYRGGPTALEPRTPRPSARGHLRWPSPPLIRPPAAAAYHHHRSEQPVDTGMSSFGLHLTLYFMSGFDSFLADHLAKLGRHKTSKACLYIKRLSDVDVAVLEETVRKGFIEAKQNSLR
jgi:hypothetical protein